MDVQDVLLHVSQHVIQAVGRIVLLDAELLVNLCVVTLVEVV